MKHEPLLTGFIKRNLASYKEHYKKRDDYYKKIRFSVKKFHSSLLMLTNLSLKEISKRVGTNYGTVRNWNQEERFLKQVQWHYVLFVDTFIQRIRIKHVERINLNRSFIKKPFKEIIKTKPPTLSYSEFSDADLYSYFLYSQILGEATTQFVDKEASWGLAYEARKILILLEGEIFAGRSKRPNKSRKEAAKKYVTETSERLKDMLEIRQLKSILSLIQKKSLSLPERKCVATILSSLIRSKNKLFYDKNKGFKPFVGKRNGRKSKPAKK